MVLSEPGGRRATSFGEPNYSLWVETRRRKRTPAVIVMCAAVLASFTILAPLGERPQREGPHTQVEYCRETSGRGHGFTSGPELFEAQTQPPTFVERPSTSTPQEGEPPNHLSARPTSKKSSRLWRNPPRGSKSTHRRSKAHPPARPLKNPWGGRGGRRDGAAGGRLVPLRRAWGERIGAKQKCCQDQAKMMVVAAAIFAINVFQVLRPSGPHSSGEPLTQT